MDHKIYIELGVALYVQELHFTLGTGASRVCQLAGVFILAYQPLFGLELFNPQIILEVWGKVKGRG